METRVLRIKMFTQRVPRDADRAPPEPIRAQVLNGLIVFRNLFSPSTVYSCTRRSQFICRRKDHRYSARLRGWRIPLRARFRRF
jgi:hypothetical protein